MNELTIFIVQLLGPLYVAIGLKMLFDQKYFCDIIEDFRKGAVAYFTGIVMMIACTALILQHNIWEYNLAGLVTLFAWGGAVKGALLIVQPEFLIRKSYCKMKGMMHLMGIFALALGVYFVYAGYFA